MSEIAAPASQRSGSPAATASRREAALKLPARPKEPSPGIAEALRLFHLAGRVRGLPPDALAGKPLRPAVAEALPDADGRVASFPLFVPADGGEPVPLRLLIQRAAAAAQKAGEDTTATGARLGQVALAVVEALAPKGRGSAREVLDEAGRRFCAALDVSEKGAPRLSEEWARLSSRLPAAGEILGLSPDALPSLALAAFRSRRKGEREAWLEDVARLARSLREKLRGEAARASRGAAPALGALASSFLDASALAGSLPAPKGPVPMGDVERAHAESAAALLEKHLASAEAGPDVLFLRPSGSRLGAALPAASVKEHARPLEAAVATFDELAAAHAEVMRAERLARLVLAGTYSPDEHDAPLAELDWRGATPREAAALPALIVLETAERVRAGGMEAFSRILSGDRPIHVIVEETLGADALGTEQPAISPAELALAHREAFVVAGTLSRPLLLDAGLRDMAVSMRPSAVIAAVAAADAPLPAETWAALAHAARLTPCLRHDPDAGDTWAERFDLAGNSQPEHDAPCLSVDVEGLHSPMPLWAGQAALAIASPAWRAHARAIPPEAWSDDQVELHEALAMPAASRGTLVPFAWAVDESGTLVRVVVTRALLQACAARARSWRLLRELAGIESSHARRAADDARSRALAEAAAREAEAQARHAAEIAALRESGAADTLDRLVSVIMNLDAAAPLPMPAPAPRAAAPAPPAPAASAAAPVAAPAAAPAAPAPAAAAEEPLSDEAYTDSVLCTTCNECTNINSRMFKYNANKQAYVADATAGTYAELVKAAEKCPARCIHVGSPRPGDATVDDALLARAKPFR